MIRARIIVLFSITLSSVRSIVKSALIVIVAPKKNRRIMRKTIDIALESYVYQRKALGPLPEDLLQNSESLNGLACLLVGMISRQSVKYLICLSGF